MKFGYFIECNMKIIFPEKSLAKCDAETGPIPFPKKLKLSISLKSKSFIQFIFIACQVEGY